LKNSSPALFRGIAALLAGLGLLPFFWAGIVSGDWNVARVTLIDPIVVGALCLAIGWRAPTLPGVFADRLGRIRPPLLVGSLAIAAIILGCIAARVGYNGQPALTDELTQAFQGRILTAGRLTAVPETYREFFESGQTIVSNGKWFAEYPIGSGVLAAIGIWSGIGMLISPVLLALAIVATWSFARRAYDERTARITVLLMALSPFAFLLAGTRMNHVPTLTLTAIALMALTHVTLESRRVHLWAAVLGAAIGTIVLFRPYDAILIAIPVGVFQLVTIARRRELIAPLITQVIVAGAITAIQLWVNARTTGSAFTFGYDLLNGPAHGPGFHRDPLGHPFTPSEGLEYVMLYLQQLNTALFESAVPALVFIVLGMWLTRPTRWDWLLAGLIFSFLAGYGAYWHRGELTGPRFLYPALVAFVVFTARFFVLAIQRERRILTASAMMLPVCIALAWLPPVLHRSTGIPLRLARVGTNPVSRAEDPAAEARAAGLKNALVFVREPLHARIAARLVALGMRPFDAERAAGDYDACALLTALAKSDAHPEVAGPDRLRAVIEEVHQVRPTKAIPGLTGFTALALVNGRPSSPECYREMAEDSTGTLFYPRFLAAATFDSAGRLGGDVIYARTLGPRDSILLKDDRFGRRQWYMYRRQDAKNTGRFERIR
jgi:hypothetical protein